MNIFTKAIFTKNKEKGPQPGPAVKEMPPSMIKSRLMKLYKGRVPNLEKVLAASSLPPYMEKWTQAEKSFYYFLIGEAIAVRSNQRDPRRFPFYAASIFHNPIHTNHSWNEIKRSFPEFAHLDHTPDNAVLMYETFPMTESFNSLLEPWDDILD